MWLKKTYRIEREGVITALECLADTLLHPYYRKRYTVVGITRGNITYKDKELIPREYLLKKRGLVAPGLDPGIFTDFLDLARELEEKGRLPEEIIISKKTDVINWLGNNLLDDEEPISVMEKYELCDKPDYYWHLILSYKDQEMILGITDNIKHGSKDKLEQLFQRMVAQFFEKHAKT